MRRIVALSIGVVLGAASWAAQAGGIHIGIGAVITGQIVPGVYGRVVIGSRPPPPLVYAHAVMVEPVPYGVSLPPPLYLYVPPFQTRDWRRYCHAYHACHRPVYFVSSPEYAPGFNLERWRREHPDWDRDRRDFRRRDEYRGYRDDHDRRWRGDDRRDDGPGDRGEHDRGWRHGGRDHWDRRDHRDPRDHRGHRGDDR